MVSQGGEVVHRPLGSALHGKGPNEVSHLNFVFMGPIDGSYKYVLIIMDDLSSYTWLLPTPFPVTYIVPEALSIWMATFGSFDWILTEQGSHFVNTLMKDPVKQLHSRHHLTVDYCPLANETVVRVCHEVLRATGSMTHELRLDPKD